MRKEILRVDNVTKIYNNQVHALKDASFSLHEGEFISVIGPSGSGKSTLLRCINQMIDVSNGNIYFMDEDVTKAKKKKI
ncbi:MAG: ATP-binding cassette domain-containing protein, partial [Longicatena sp.]